MSQEELQCVLLLSKHTRTYLRPWMTWGMCRCEGICAHVWETEYAVACMQYEYVYVRGWHISSWRTVLTRQVRPVAVGTVSAPGVATWHPKAAHAKRSLYVHHSPFSAEQSEVTQTCGAYEEHKSLHFDLMGPMPEGGGIQKLKDGERGRDSFSVLCRPYSVHDWCDWDTQVVKAGNKKGIWLPSVSVASVSNSWLSGSCHRHTTRITISP